MRKIVSIVAWTAAKWIDSLPFLLLSSWPLWGRCGRRGRRHSPCSRRSACFAWRSGCRAQCAAQSAGGGRKRRRQGRTGRSRRGESRTQGETHMYMDDKWWNSDLSHEVYVRQDEQSVTKIARSQCMLRWCACCACRCSCCSLSHACPHCSCHCCSFCRRVFVANFAVLGGILFTPRVGDSKLRWLLPN